MSIIRIVTLFAILLSACRENESDRFLTGVWSNGVDRNIDYSRLELREGYGFYVYNFPSKLICGSGDDIKVKGTGTWEYDRAMHRIILIFNNISGEICSYPYAGNAFVKSELFDINVVFYPDGPDNKTSAVIFKKIEP